MVAVLMIVISAIGAPGAAEEPEDTAEEGCEWGIAPRAPDGSAEVERTDCDDDGIADSDELESGVAADSDEDGTLDNCEPIPGDADRDGDVDEQDGAIVGASYGFSEGEPQAGNGGADFDEDRDIDAGDVAIFVKAFVASGRPRYECADGVDNDRDGSTDFPADPECRSPIFGPEHLPRDGRASEPR